MDDKTLFIAVFGGIFCGLGLIFLLVAIVIASSQKNKMKVCTSKAIGTIIDVKQRTSISHEHSSSNYYPVIQYVTADGRTIVKESSFGGSKSTYKTGQEMRLLYNPSNPDEFYMPDDKIPKILKLVFSLVGVGMLLIGSITSILVYFLV